MDAGGLTAEEACVQIRTAILFRLGDELSGTDLGVKYLPANKHIAIGDKVLMLFGVAKRKPGRKVNVGVKYGDKYREICKDFDFDDAVIAAVTLYVFFHEFKENV